MPVRAASALSSSHRCGVGIDTSRYGHYAVFLREDLQPAADELAFSESAAGYALLRQRLDRIVQRQGDVHFVVRLDAAGQYADTLLHFLHRLGAPSADTPPPSRCPSPVAIRNATRTTAPRCSAPTSPIPWRLAPRLASPWPNGRRLRRLCLSSCVCCGRWPAASRPWSANAPA